MTRVPAVEGWFTTEGEPALLGSRCTSCSTYVFPPGPLACPNPDCDGSAFDEVQLSRRGRLWSWTVNHYPPPAPYMAPDPFEPYGVAAVELPTERVVVLGQISGATDGLVVGDEMELVVETLFTDEEAEHVVWRWRKAGAL